MAGPWEKYQAQQGPWTKYGSTPAMPALTADPTGTTGENILAGTGKAFSDTAKGSVQRSAEVFANAPDSLPLIKAIGLMLNKLGISPEAMSASLKADAAETKRLDKPLMDTGGGKVGNIGGNVALIAPTAAAPGANTIPGAAMVGGLSGAAQQSESPMETAKNAALGTAGGAGGQWLANKVPGALKAIVDKVSNPQGAQAQKFAAAQAASKEGYVIPPADLQPGVLSEAVSAFAGKVKTAQQASAKNQAVTDKLARKAIGLNEGDELTLNVLNSIRNDAATKGYAPVAGSGTVKADAQLFKALDDIAATQQSAARSFPGLTKNEVPDLIATLKQPTFEASDAVAAIRLLRSEADKAYLAGDKTLGKANRSAAEAMESMLERHLTAIGQPDALKAFQEARKLIAKTYTVQKGLNDQTGSVAAQRLARDLAKGKPLADELRTIAETATAFPQATQALKEAPKALSPLDMAVAAGGVGTGNPMMAAWLGRPIARNMMLSGPVQARAIQPGGAPLTQATQRLLESRMAQLLAAPAGVTGGIELAQ